MGGQEVENRWPNCSTPTYYIVGYFQVHVVQIFEEKNNKTTIKNKNLDP